MAKRAKMTDEPETGDKTIDAQDLRRVVDEINRQKSNASEYAGLAGKATQQAVENYGLERQALTWSRKLDGTEAVKRQSVFSALLDYCDKLGHFDQLDAFGGPLAKMAEIVNRQHNSIGAQPADADLNERLVN